MTYRVAITGIGMVTSLGADPAGQWRRLLAGDSGIAAVTRQGSPAFRYFAPVEDSVMSLPPGNRKVLRLLARPSILGLRAAEQALADSGGSESARSERMGIYVGSGEKDPAFFQTIYPLIEHGRATDGSLDVRRMAEEGLRFLNPSCLLSWLPNSSLCQVTIRHGIRGANATLSEDSPSGMDAIGAAFRSVRAGRADMIVCGGTECLIDPVIRNSHDMLGLLSSCHSGQASFRPFDERRDGYIAGEGAAFVILEELTRAQLRGGRIYAEIMGFGSGTDTTPVPCGGGLRRAVTRALDDGGVRPGGIDMIVAHGAGTTAGDAAELTGLRQALGAHAERIPVCAVKPTTGYIGAAGDIVQALVATWALRDGLLPPILNLVHPDPAGARFQFVRESAASAAVSRALAVSQACVGGQASALLLQRPPDRLEKNPVGRGEQRSAPTISAAR
jgi:3-oxoacyl-[acyl-carrier-protein] synthase II